MNLISAHRDGLAEQLESEAEGLAGRPRDTVQRAIVCHHLFDHSGGRHGYALLAGVASLALDGRIEALRATARRGRWRLGARGAGLAERVEQFADAMRRLDRERCAALLIAYRSARHPALAEAVAGELRTEGDAGTLFAAWQRRSEERWGAAIDEAVAALEWPLGGRRLAPLLDCARIPLSAFDAAEKRGWRTVERGLLRDPRMPAGFAANPARHYFTMRAAIAERRRRDSMAGFGPDESLCFAA